MRIEESLKVIYLRLIFLLWALFIFSWPNIVVGEGSNIIPGDIIITEIMANPKVVSDTAGEWLEIYNPTENDFDLSGCEFSDNGSNKFIITGLIIPAETYLVLGRNNNPEENGGILPDYTYSGYTLANTEDAIILTCQNREIDRVEYSLVLGFTVPDGASFILKNTIISASIGVYQPVSLVWETRVHQKLPMTNAPSTIQLIINRRSYQITNHQLPKLAAIKLLLLARQFDLMGVVLMIRTVTI